MLYRLALSVVLHCLILLPSTGQTPPDSDIVERAQHFCGCQW